MLYSHRLMSTCLMLWSSLSAGAQAPIHSVKIIANGYMGKLANSGDNTFFFLHGDTVLDMKANDAGAYQLNTGSSIDDISNGITSYITIFFNAAGLIDSIHPRASATVGSDRKGIGLNTSTVVIDPGKFTMAWYPSFGVDMGVDKGFYYGKQTLKLIKGQVYNIDQTEGSLVWGDVCHQPRYYGSYFYFALDESGNFNLFNLNKASVEAKGSRLRFKTKKIIIDPMEISNGTELHIPAPYSHPIVINRKTALYFVRATVSYLYWTNVRGEEERFHILTL